MLTAKQIKGLVIDYWFVPVLALVLISTAFYLFCGGKSETDDLKRNIDQQKGVNAVLTNQITNQEGVVNNAANQSNQAEANLADSINRDSNSFHGNSTDQFCARFCHDSTCVEWRKTHECR